MENLIFNIAILIVIPLIFILTFAIIKKIIVSPRLQLWLDIYFIVFNGIFVVYGIVDDTEIAVVTGIFSVILGLIKLKTISNNVSHKSSLQDRKTKKNYPMLSVISIMRKYKSEQKIQTIYLLLIATIIYIFAGRLFDFAISNIFSYVLLGSSLAIALELLIFNYRVNKSWYGSIEFEAREIIKFIVENSENIDFTDGNSPKSIIKPEDIQQIGKELGIQIPGYPEPNAINKRFSEG